MSRAICNSWLIPKVHENIQRNHDDIYFIIVAQIVVIDIVSVKELAVNVEQTDFCVTVHPSVIVWS